MIKWIQHVDEILRKIKALGEVVNFRHIPRIYHPSNVLKLDTNCPSKLNVPKLVKIIDVQKII